MNVDRPSATAKMGDRYVEAEPAPLPAGHPAVTVDRIGVLLVNLGTPDAPTSGAVRRYLSEFLSDRRVVELPSLIWQPILCGIVLAVRPRKSARAYREIWTSEGSPLAAITRRQARALQASLGGDAVVAHAMRYGSGPIPDGIDALLAAGCRRILVAPLYPQYCAATTASVGDALAAHLTGPQYRGMLGHIGAFGVLASSSRKFAVSREGSVYNSHGVASAAFD